MGSMKDNTFQIFHSLPRSHIVIEKPTKKEFDMKMLVVSRKITVSILMMLVLICGLQGVSYAEVCRVGDVLSPGESCTYVANGVDVVFSVEADGTACREGGPITRNIGGLTINIGHINFCTGSSIARDDTFNSNFSASKNADSSWTINTVPGAAPPPVQQPDLVVEQPTVSKSTLAPGESFTLSATVTNEGAGSSPSTTLRYYRSTNATISSVDTAVGTDSVSSLGSNRSGAENITLTAPNSPGTYYYGACVDSVSDESRSDNNCSAAVSITVEQPTQPTGQTTYSVGEDIPTLPTGSYFPSLLSGASFVSSGGTVTINFNNGGLIVANGITYTCVASGGCGIEGRRVTRGTIEASGGQSPPSAQKPDLVIESVEIDPATVDPGEEFSLYATLRNSGTEASAATTVRYYQSTDNIISTNDTQLGTGSRSSLAPNASIRRFLNVTAPTTPGTYYYGVCVDSVTNESNTDNNCSAAVVVTVGAPVVSTSPHPFIYWTDSGTEKIQRANLDGSNVEDLVTTGLEVPIGIALDVAGGKMYWTDAPAEKIQRANLDGSNVEDLVTQQGWWSLGYIALDVAGGKMYWTDWGTDKIRRANLDGSNVEDLVTQGLETPRGIALDVAGGKMYWTDSGTEKIQRANLDGSNVEDLVTTGLEVPIGIALDVAGGKMYWTDYNTEKIQRANLDGSNIEDLVTTGLRGPIGIALDVAGGKMYWTDEGTDTDKIQRANLDGSNVEDLVTQGLRAPRGIALGIPSQSLPPIAREDVNGDRVVDVQDMVYVAQHYGQTGQNRADVNGDGVVNIDDIVLVAAVVDNAPAAPSIRSQLPKDLTAATVSQWLTEAKLTGDKTLTYQRGILTLEQLLAALTPKETALLPNYPNPFNPETWIPYHLSTDADVSLSIYDVNGVLVRELDLGHQQAGYYTGRTKAAYWDGRNAVGEQVASGVYFYHLKAGDHSQTRKMLILK